MTSPQFTRFSIPRFLFLVALQCAAPLLIMRLVFPAFWQAQWSAGIGSMILVFLGAQFFNAGVEWFFHRYILHAAPFAFMANLAEAHRRHHALTAIRLRPNEAGPGRIVINEYPIEKEEQYESAAFPWYALAIFWLVLTPPILIVQLLLPNSPIVLIGLFSVAWSDVSYEVVHAVEHYPYDWWKRFTEHRVFGGLGKEFYGFHHFHHANISCNEAISGFVCGLPVWDWMMRTRVRPQRLLLHGLLATADEFKIPKPWPFVAALDNWAKRRESRRIKALA